MSADYTRVLAAANPTGWFEDLYVEADAGTASVPWDVPNPQPHLVEWAAGLSGSGRRALVVGCGYGRDSEFLATLGFDVVAFDISPTGIAATRARYPSSPVSYVVADLLNPPAEWHRAFDLVVENMTVQALPVALHAKATARVASLVGDTLLVLSGARDEGPAPEGPPWPLTPSEIAAFSCDGLSERSVLRKDGRWVAEFRR